MDERNEKKTLPPSQSAQTSSCLFASTSAQPLSPTGVWESMHTPSLESPSSSPLPDLIVEREVEPRDRAAAFKEEYRELIWRTINMPEISYIESVTEDLDLDDDFLHQYYTNLFKPRQTKVTDSCRDAMEETSSDQRNIKQDEARTSSSDQNGTITNAKDENATQSKSKSNIASDVNMTDWIQVPSSSSDRNITQTQEVMSVEENSGFPDKGIKKTQSQNEPKTRSVSVLTEINMKTASEYCEIQSPISPIARNIVSSMRATNNNDSSQKTRTVSFNSDISEESFVLELDKSLTRNEEEHEREVQEDQEMNVTDIKPELVRVGSQEEISDEEIVPEFTSPVRVRLSEHEMNLIFDKLLLDQDVEHSTNREEVTVSGLSEREGLIPDLDMAEVGEEAESEVSLDHEQPPITSEATQEQSVEENSAQPLSPTGVWESMHTPSLESPSSSPLPELIVEREVEPRDRAAAFKEEYRELIWRTINMPGISVTDDSDFDLDDDFLVKYYTNLFKPRLTKVTDSCRDAMEETSSDQRNIKQDEARTSSSDQNGTITNAKDENATQSKSKSNIASDANIIANEVRSSSSDRNITQTQEVMSVEENSESTPLYKHIYITKRTKAEMHREQPTESHTTQECEESAGKIHERDDDASRDMIRAEKSTVITGSFGRLPRSTLGCSCARDKSVSPEHSTPQPSLPEPASEQFEASLEVSAPNTAEGGPSTDFTNGSKRRLTRVSHTESNGQESTPNKRPKPGQNPIEARPQNTGRRIKSIRFVKNPKIVRVCKNKNCPI